MKIEPHHIEELSSYLKNIVISNVKGILSIDIDLNLVLTNSFRKNITYEITNNGSKLFNVWNQYNSPILKNSILNSIIIEFGHIENLNLEISLLSRKGMYFEILLLPNNIILTKKLNYLIG